jgi:hypothetical protein
MAISTPIMIEIIKKITINAHITKNMIEEGKVIHAHRKNDAVIDQLSLLLTKLSEPDATPDGPVPATQS